MASFDDLRIETDRLILRPPPQLDAPALERFATETGRALGLTP